MSQTDYARRRQCVPPPSVKGRRSVFPRRIAGEAVFFTVFKSDPEKNTSTKTSAPFTIAYELPPQFARGCGLLARVSIGVVTSLPTPQSARGG